MEYLVEGFNKEFLIDDEMNKIRAGDACYDVYCASVCIGEGGGCTCVYPTTLYGCSGGGYLFPPKEKIASAGDGTAQ